MILLLVYSFRYSEPGSSAGRFRPQRCGGIPVRPASQFVVFRGQVRPEAAYPQRLAQRAAPGKLQLHVMADC